jgi:xylulokinase
MAHFVGLDVGTTSVKGLAVSQDGEVVASAEEEYPLSTPRPGWAEQDPEDWWRATQSVLSRLAGDGAPAGIGLSGQMHGLVALGAGDEVLRPAILWNDGRTGAQCAEIESRVGRERLVALTGNRALTGFTAPKLLWLRDEEPETFASIESVLLPKDYVRLKLTGEKAMDPAGRVGDAAVRRGGPAAGVLTCSRRSSCRSNGCRPCSSPPRRPARHPRECPWRSAPATRRPGAVGVGVVGAGGPLVRGARDVGRRLRRAARIRV